MTELIKIKFKFKIIVKMPTRGTAKSRTTRSQRSKKVLDAFKEESKIQLENPFKPTLEKVVEEKIIIKAAKDQ
jgi:hypothetical protein